MVSAVTALHAGQQPESLSGSLAALGVLMGQVFHRSTGRGWRLRQRSLELWAGWRRDLEARGHRIPYRPGLLLLAADPQERERQKLLAAQRGLQGLPLRFWEREQLAVLRPALPDGALGGLYSPLDGQLDPGAALQALGRDGTAAGLTLLADAATSLKPPSPGGLGGGWRVERQSGGWEEAEWVVLAAGMGCAPLLATAGIDRPLEPVLGQALELELAGEAMGLRQPPGAEGREWPGAVVWRGTNLIPRPDLPGGRSLWLGATLEPGEQAERTLLDSLPRLGGAAPPWLRQARERRRWQGIRARPVGRPAPLLEQLAPGLLLAGGHYRNGVLLAPASAEWVADRVEQEPADGRSPGGATTSP